MNDASSLAALLGWLRDGRRRPLGLQSRALELQQRQLAACEAQLARLERINDRAEALQDRAGRSLRLAGRVVLPAVIVATVLIYGVGMLRLFGTDA
jgi:hypothetical protein